MKLILAGHEDTKQILPASSWLVDKYLPEDFEVFWLNYGEYSGRLFRGKYIELDEEQFGGVESWSNYVQQFVETLKDDKVIFGLDDYLINDYLNMEMYSLLLETISTKYACGRFCDSTFFKNKEIDGNLIIMGENEYNVTAQICLWNRDVLLDMLAFTNSPWEFEIHGTKMFNEYGYKTIGTTPQALSYADTGALSRKWEGIKTDGVKEKDLINIQENGLI